MSKISQSSDEDGQIISLPKSPRIEDKKCLDVDKQGKLTSQSVEKAPAFGLVNFFTLRVLILDIGVALGDVVSDFAQVCLS